VKLRKVSKQTYSFVIIFVGMVCYMGVDLMFLQLTWQNTAAATVLSALKTIVSRNTERKKEIMEKVLLIGFFRAFYNAEKTG
jgi:hypothetical protein